MKRILGTAIMSLTLVISFLLFATPAQAADCTWSTAVPYAYQDSNGYWHIQGHGYLQCGHSHAKLYIKVALQKRLPGDPTWYTQTYTTKTLYSVQAINQGVDSIVHPQIYYTDWRTLIVRAYAQTTSGSYVVDFRNKTDGLHLHINLN